MQLIIINRKKPQLRWARAQKCASRRWEGLWVWSWFPCGRTSQQARGTTLISLPPRALPSEAPWEADQNRGTCHGLFSWGAGEGWGQASEGLPSLRSPAQLRHNLGSFKQQKCNVSQPRGLKVQNQGVSRAMLPRRLSGALALVASCVCWQILASPDLQTRCSCFCLHLPSVSVSLHLFPLVFLICTPLPRSS